MREFRTAFEKLKPQNEVVKKIDDWQTFPDAKQERNVPSYTIVGVLTRGNAAVVTISSAGHSKGKTANLHNATARSAVTAATTGAVVDSSMIGDTGVGVYCDPNPITTRAAQVSDDHVFVVRYSEHSNI